MTLASKELIVFDGGFGTGLQSLELDPSAFGEERYVGCNEYLNLSQRDAVVHVHQAFLAAGCDVIETNTFGASKIVLDEYGLADKVEEINAAAVANARTAIGNLQGRFVVGSIGPGTRLPSLGQISFDEMHAAYLEQMRALVQAGVDGLMIETCQDLGQIKIALIAAFDAQEDCGREIPVMLSVTVETSGTLLVGTSLAAVVATVEPYPIFSLGLNCATGPEAMSGHIKQLSRTWNGRISVLPNAGLPKVEDGKMVYDLSPALFAEHVAKYVETAGVSIVGGCCGTTAEHLSALILKTRGLQPKLRSPEYKPSLSSLYTAIEARQEIPPLIVGERMNSNGSKKFRERLLEDDYDGALELGRAQENGGAHVLDICTAYAGRDEIADISEMVGRLREAIKLPLVIDSTTPAAVEAALKLQPGRSIINSINLEDGGKTLGQICTLAKRHGAAVIALTIHEDGMAMTTDDKVKTAQRIHDLAVNTYGLRSSDLFFDTLTFTLGSGDPSLETAAVETLEAIKRLKVELPGVFNLLGVSNISFGLSPASRRILNSMFLHEAIDAGLDAGIVDAAKVLPLNKISEEDRGLCLDLIYNRHRDDDLTPLTAFIEHFKGRKKKDDDAGVDTSKLPPEKQLEAKLVNGDKDDLHDVLQILLAKYRAVDILNNILIPAMRKVGELFGKGEMLLPFVLQSAEVMKRAVAVIEPYMDKADQEQGTRVLLATVKGDVHDIGKNLVDIILSNNGCQVFNLGINISAEIIAEKAREYNVDVIGLSGLLVKSAMVMAEDMPFYNESNLKVPILLGGAALTPKFVAESCVPKYESPVVYCADAFAGLKAVKEMESGALSATEYTPLERNLTGAPGPKASEVLKDSPVPQAPFMGFRHVTDIDPSALYSYLNEQALIRGRWGYRRGKSTKEEYEALVTGTVQPILEDLKRKAIDENWLQAKAAYGYFKAYSEDDTVVLEHEGRTHRFGFPRQGFPPHRCISDYFKPQSAGGDVAGLFVVTIGDALAKETKKLFEGDAFHDYLILHGFGTEVTDALAEYWHEKMRIDLGIGSEQPADTVGYVGQQYQGSRYGFGYPACPDLGLQIPLFELIRGTEIGIELTENLEMVPEFSTSAIVAHHPQAKYFAV